MNSNKVYFRIKEHLLLEDTFRMFSQNTRKYLQDLSFCTERSNIITMSSELLWHYLVHQQQ